MFESLNKMVKIENNKLFTIDPFAYTYFINNDDIMNFNKRKVLPVSKFRM